LFSGKSLLRNVRNTRFDGDSGGLISRFEALLRVVRKDRVGFFPRGRTPANEPLEVRNKLIEENINPSHRELHRAACSQKSVAVDEPHWVLASQILFWL